MVAVSLKKVAKQHVHQGGLAGAIFAEQGQHLALKEFEVNGVIGNNRAETFRQPVEGENFIL